MTPPGSRRLARTKPEKHLYNNYSRVAVQAVCGELVSGAGAAISLLNREKTGNFLKNSLIEPQICR